MSLFPIGRGLMSGCTSESMWAIHTRDYRVNNPQNCQILVTVPEMFAIMLLSPPLARVWTPRIKRYVYAQAQCIVG